MCAYGSFFSPRLECWNVQKRDSTGRQKQSQQALHQRKEVVLSIRELRVYGGDDENGKLRKERREETS
jgi:hypothetical protein